MRRIVWWMAAVVTAALVSACGGGGGSSGDCTFACDGGGDTSTVAELRIALSSQTIANQSSTPVTVTVTAVNAANQTVSGASVLVSASNGGVVTTTAAVTDSAGVLEATVGAGSDTTPRSITITAVSGSVTKTASVDVVEGAGSGDASMSLTMSSQTVTAASPATVTVVVRDATGKVVPSAVVSFTSTRGLGKFSAPSALTDTNGQASVALYPITSTSSGADDVVASVTVDGTDLTASQGFQINATAVSIASITSDLNGAKLSAYGQANITVTLSGTTNGTPVALSVVSLCANKGKATITPTETTTTNGAATFTYKDAQCGATDTADTVQVTITGTATTSALSIPLSTPSASSLGFGSASPETIYLKGSGFAETSTVTFVVKDQAGNPLPNQSVDLTPITTAGGVTMDGGIATVTKLSDSNGQVTVRINSGTVPTPVRVKATLTGTTITTVSSNLSVAVGLPSQRNFSLSQKTINIEGMDIDGTPNSYTIIASDRMANPVPAGTTINFVGEGSQVQPQAFTSVSNGLASATANFQSSDPRPINGRITILAYALGEESFLDKNGDNVWTAGEAYQDLGDVFLSRSFSKDYNAAVDEYISLGINGSKACVAGTPDPLGLLTFNASIPSVGASTCDGKWGKAYVRRAVETVLSTSASRLMWYRAAAGQVSNVSGGTLDSDCTTVSVVGDSGAAGTYFNMGDGAIYGLPQEGGLTFMVSDTNPNRLNPMPAGTTLSVTATSGISTNVGGGSPVANTPSATSGFVGYKFADDTLGGSIFISTRSPSGLVTSYGIGVTRSGTPPSGAACSR